MTYDWSKMVKMTVPVGLCGWQQRGSLTINGRTTEFPVGVETELPEPVAERVKALMADAEEKAEHVQPLKPWMQYVTGADGVARWEPRLAYAETEEVKTIDPDKMGKNAGANKVLVTDENGEAEWSDSLAGGAGGGGGIIYVQELKTELESGPDSYADRALTQKMDYATGKAILLSGGFVCTPNDIDGMAYDICVKPLAMIAIDEHKVVQVVTINPKSEGAYFNIGLMFSDSAASG